MNSFFLDPDSKINMSLDEIIKLTNSVVADGQAHGGVLKKRKRFLNKNNQNQSDSHSVPMMSRLGGGYIYVTKKSPLLGVDNRRKIIQAISNRILNSELLETKKEIIPATYKIVKTTKGLERILVPAENHNSINKPQLRLLRKPTSEVAQTDCPPPLINTLIYSPPPIDQPIKMEVSDSDDEVILLESDNWKKKPPVIDVESNRQMDSIEPGQGFVAPLSVAPQTGVKLNDRFTFLTGTFQF